MSSIAGKGGRCAGGVGFEGNIGRLWLEGDNLRLNENGDDLPSGQTERTVVQDPEKAGDLSRVAGDAKPCLVVLAKDIIQCLLGANVLSSAGLGEGLVPELIVLGEAGLELVPGEHVLDVSLG